MSLIRAGKYADVHNTDGGFEDGMPDNPQSETNFISRAVAKINLAQCIAAIVISTAMFWGNYLLAQQALAHDIDSLKKSDARQDERLDKGENFSEAQVALIVQKLQEKGVVTTKELDYRLKPITDGQADQKRLLEQILYQQGIRPAPGQ